MTTLNSISTRSTGEYQAISYTSRYCYLAHRKKKVQVEH
jgi:hypothetical protein